MVSWVAVWRFLICAVTFLRFVAVRDLSEQVNQLHSQLVDLEEEYGRIHDQLQGLLETNRELTEVLKEEINSHEQEQEENNDTMTDDTTTAATWKVHFSFLAIYVEFYFLSATTQSLIMMIMQ